MTEVKKHPKVVLKLKDVKLAPYNPRFITKEEREKLKRSLGAFGYADLMVHNKRTGNVVGGNQRLIVLMEDFNWTEAEFVQVDMPLTHEKLLNVALNKIAGEWDYEKLTDLFQSFDKGVDLSLTGFEEAETKILLNADLNIPETEQELPNEKADASPTTSYVIYLTFSKLQVADAWLKKNFGKNFKKDSTTTVVDMDKHEFPNSDSKP